MLIPEPHRDYIQEIADIIYKIDSVCRSDFQNNFIVSERDYISIFLNHIRRPFGIFSSTTLAHSQTLNGSHERDLGCDGIIIFRNGDNYKVGLFEAKIIKPRFDSLVRNPKNSRFQRQIDKQGLINPSIAVWEMFINKDTLNPTLDTLGSTCVKLDIAQKHTKSGPLWSLSDLMNLISRSYKSNNYEPLNYGQLIREILSCNFGEMHQYSQPEISFSEELMDVKIPIVKDEFTSEDQVRIQEFLEKTGITTYTQINISAFISDLRDKRIAKITK